MTTLPHTWSAFCAAVLLTGAVSTASAESPHFVGKVTASLVDTEVQVCWKEAGLGNNQLVDYLATADGTATYVCVNNGGQCPDAANKITVNGPVTATGTFASGQNGQITACLILDPPGPGTFTCPHGQTRTLADEQFANIAITDTTNDETRSTTPVSLGATLFVCPGP
jgi:hypothetical protein